MTGGADAVFSATVPRTTAHTVVTQAGALGRVAVERASVFSENSSPSAVDLKSRTVCFWKYTHRDPKNVLQAASERAPWL